MHDTIQERRASLEEYVHGLEYPKGSRGVVAAIDGNFAALDLLDRSETLERIWRRFVTGCALDAIRVEQRMVEPLAAKDVEVLLEHISEVECEPCPSVGMGEDWRFESEAVVGQALVVGGACVHLSVSPNTDADRRCCPRAPRQTEGPPRRSPRQTRRRRRDEDDRQRELFG